MNQLSERLARLSPIQQKRVLDEWRARRRDETPPIPSAAHDGGDFPLSFAQERLWFLDQLSPGSASYNISSAHRIPFAVNHDVLERALTALVRRHGALRTIFPIVNGDPVQRVLPPEAIRCDLVDLRSMPALLREAEAQRLATDAAQRPFDIAAGPVFRATLVRLGPSESAFLFVVHHIVADSVTMEIVFRELGMLYADAAAGRSPTLGDPPVQYADFAVWQRNWLRGDRLASELAYWQGQLKGLGTLNLATDRPRPPVQRDRGAHLDIRMSRDVRRALYELAGASSATPFMVLIAAFFVLLHRYTQQDDLAVGVPIANRTRLELEGVVGFFANSLVMRADLSGNPSFREALARVRETALQAYSHQDVPFSAVVAALRPEQDLSRNPLFQVSFQLISRADRHGENSSSSLAFERGTAIFDLVLNLWEQGDEIQGLVEYNTDLFDRDTVQRMLRHYLTLLDAIVATPDLPIRSLPMLANEERERMIIEWNATESECPDCGVHMLVEEQVHKTPDSVALRQGTNTITYAELDSTASRLARSLQRRFPDQHRRIGVMLPVSFEMVAAVLAILKAGDAYVPLDPSTPPRRLSAMLDAAAVDVVLTPSEWSDRVPADRASLTIADAQSDASPDTSSPLPATDGSDLAYIMFTSGSTGTPKGVMVRHRGVVNYLTWCRGAYPVSVGACAPLCSPLWSDMSITALFLPLISGGSVVLLDQDDVVEALDTALRSGPTFSFVKLTPSHLEALRGLALGREAPRNTAAFIVGGEALTGETLALWRDQASDVMVFNEYGPTETVVGCAVHAARAGDLAPGPMPIGRPIANTRLYVLDPLGQPVPAGVPGELYIGGAGVALGYVGAQLLTEERFLPNPFCPGDQIYRTGDLVRYLAGGVLEYLGRLDGQLKIRGYRVEPGDVEVAIRRHAAVTDAAVIARDLGSGDRRLVAYVVVAQAERERSAEVVQDLRDVLRRELPAYMVPSSVIVIDEMPLTAAGKVDGRALEKRSGDEQVRREAPVPPSTDLERVIALVFEDVLRTTPVAANDDFFADLGAHSLLATRAVARLRDLLRFDLPLRWLFESPTVKSLAAVMRADQAQGSAVERVATVVLTVMNMSDDQVSHHLASPSRTE